MQQTEFENQSDKSLIESQATLKAIIENTSDNIWAINTAYEIIYINAVFKREFQTSFGVQLEKGMNILESLPGSIRDTWKARYDRALQNEQFVFEDKIESENSTVYIQVAMNPILVDGKVIGATFFASNITARKKIEQILRDSEEKHHTLFENMAQGVIYQDSEGRIINANKAAEKILGLSLAQMRGRKSLDPDWKSIREDGSDFPVEEHPAMVALKTGKPVYNSLMGVLNPRRGKYIWANINSIPQFKTGENKAYKVFSTFEDVTERKQVENALRESEEKYRLMVLYSNDPIFSFNSDETYRFVNEAFAKAFGKKPEEIIGKTPHDIFPFDEAEKRLKMVRQVFKTGVNGEIEVKVVTATGEERYYLTVVDAIKDQEGVIQWVACISKDITGRKKAEVQVKRNLRFTEALLKSIPTPFFFKDTQCRYLGCNQAFSEQMGVSADDIYGKTTMELWPASQAEVYHQKDLELLANPGRQVYEHAITDKDGIICNVIFFKDAFYDENGQVAGIVGAYIDISERKKTEEFLKQKNDEYLQVNEKLNQTNEELVEASEKLEESEYKIRSMFENTLTGFVYFTADGRILEANPAALNILGSPSLEATKQINVLTFKPLINNGFSQEIVNCIQQKKVISNDIIYKSKWGKSIFVKYFLIPIQLHEKVVGVWANLQDLTDLWNTQTALKAAKEKAEESDRLKSAFLANMSHEIRTPMNGILGFANLLKEPNLTGEKQQDFISIIEKSGERMLNIINDLIDISKIESGQMEAFLSETNINEQIEFIYNFFKPEVERKGMQFFYKHPMQDNEASIYTDREKIYAILTNLVKNAIKYCHVGSIELGYTKKGEYIEFYVNDTGIGIPETSQKAIFNRFVQADTNDKKAVQGAGLGLSIAKAYVEMLGGKIWVVSEPAKGTSFYFSIPYNTRKTSNKNTDNNLDYANKKGENKKLKILIAEDDETSDLLITLTLKAISYEILHAKTGVEAVDKCRNNPDIDLVLMDIKMPEMDGYEATKMIRQFNNKVVIIAQTAFVLTGDREKAMETGCNDYITKPLNTSLLKQLIEKHIDDGNWKD